MKRQKSSTFVNKSFHKVKEHCHYTGKQRGAVHSIFNVKYSIPKEFSLVLFTMNQTMFIILPSKNYQKTLKKSLIV